MNCLEAHISIALRQSDLLRNIIVMTSKSNRTLAVMRGLSDPPPMDFEILGVSEEAFALFLAQAHDRRTFPHDVWAHDPHRYFSRRLQLPPWPSPLYS